MKYYHLIHDQKKISVQEDGDGDTTLLLLHGNSCSKEIWIPLFESDLKNRFRLVAFDLPGHGKSERALRPELTYTPSGLAECVSDIVNLLQLKSVVLIGNSLGGHVAIHSIDKIKNLKGIVVQGTPPIGSLADFPKAFLPHPLAGLFQSNIVEKDQVKVLFDQLFINRNSTEMDVECFLSTDPVFREMFTASVIKGNGLINELDALKNALIPKLLMHAMGDVLINVGYVKEIATSTHSTFIDIDGGHLLPLDNPESIVKTLSPFLDKAVVD